MAELLSINGHENVPKENPFKHFFSSLITSFNSLHLFTRLLIFTVLIVIIVTPFFLNTPLETQQKAASTTPTSSSPCTVKSIVPYKTTSSYMPYVAQVNNGVQIGTSLVPLTSTITPTASPGTTISPTPTAEVYQLYSENLDGSNHKCLSCTAGQGVGEPPVEDHKMFAKWRPQGDWIILGVETNPLTLLGNELGIRNGYYYNMYAIKPDGSAWYLLTNYGITFSTPLYGLLNPTFNHKGDKIVWSKLVTGPGGPTIAFGYWQLWEANFVVDANGVPHLQHPTNISPVAPNLTGNWFEPEDWSLDDTKVLLSSDMELSSVTPLPTGATQAGQDIFTIDVSGVDLKTGDISKEVVTNLTNTMTQWDEHPFYSASGNKIIWMSSLPYAATVPVVTASNLKTEIMIMNSDGSSKQQISHFNTPGYRDYSSTPSIAGGGSWSVDGTQARGSQMLITTYFSAPTTWLYKFAGSCGGSTITFTPTPTPASK